MKVKPLEWTFFEVSEGQLAWNTVSPAFDLGYASIYFEEGKYWGTWADAPNKGFDKAEELKAIAQETHDKWVMGFIE